MMDTSCPWFCRCLARAYACKRAPWLSVLLQVMVQILISIFQQEAVYACDFRFCRPVFFHSGAIHELVLQVRVFKDAQDFVCKGIGGHFGNQAVFSIGDFVVGCREVCCYDGLMKYICLADKKMFGRRCRML